MLTGNLLWSVMFGVLFALLAISGGYPLAGASWASILGSNAGLCVLALIALMRELKAKG